MPLPNDWELQPVGLLRARATAGSDLFYMPGIREIDDISSWAQAVEGDFTVSIQVSVEGDTFADGAGILLRSPSAWAKSCIERKRRAGWSVVTVVSVPISDESYGPHLLEGCGTLLATRQDRRIAFFWHSQDHSDWEFIRTFWWPDSLPIELGFFTQAPFSGGHTVIFDHFVFDRIAWKDQR